MSTSDEFSLPNRLIRDGRDVDDNFEPREKLYHRFNKLQQSEGVLYPASIRFPDFSVNRGKYSEPNDVLLYDYPSVIDWGVASFKVEDIPPPHTTGEGTEYETTYSFAVKHVPIEENYSHSEVRTYKNGNYSKDMEVGSKKVKLRFRIYLGNRISIEKEPE